MELFEYIFTAAMIFLYAVQMIAAIEAVIRWIKMLHRHCTKKETSSAGTDDVSANENLTADSHSEGG